MSEGEVPSDWRKAVVTPIFKKGDKQLPGNYRPVSLTSILCKVCESLIRDKLMEHLNDNNLLSEDQYGFRPGRSCTTQLLEVLEHWSALMDSSFPIDVIYLDFSKAFDTVPHERLLHKLYTLGIHGNVLTWIQSFLSGRTQCVRYRDVYSSWSSVLSGVPQRSVLGPVLCLCFSNDLPETVSGLVKIFADDSNLFSNVLDEESRSKLQEDQVHSFIHSLFPPLRRF
ncbi:MAG: reverse transcriptase family protein [Sedimenticola sp.]